MQEAISSRALRGRRLSRCDGAKMVITVRSGSASLSACGTEQTCVISVYYKAPRSVLIRAGIDRTL